MLALLLSLCVTAAPSPRLDYETKCLYCHSEEVTEHTRMTEPAWRKLIEQMRRKAPLLISRSDVGRLTKYMTQTLKLVAPARGTKPAVPVTVDPAVPVTTRPPEPLPPTPPPEPVAAVEPEPGPDEPAANPADPAMEQQAFELMQQRCSKCHTLSRVYAKLDTFERSMAVLERMRLKTGSGITNRDMALLEDYLRGQF
jgi:cytochrome c5